MKKLFAILLVVVLCVTMFAGCSKVSRVSHNMPKEADNFNVTRRIAVINARTDKPIFEMIGNFSIDNNGSNELELTVEVAEGHYKKHFVYLNDYTLYVVENVSGAFVDKYHYEVNYIPEMINPITITEDD